MRCRGRVRARGTASARRGGGRRRSWWARTDPPEAMPRAAHRAAPRYDCRAPHAASGPRPSTGAIGARDHHPQRARHALDPRRQLAGTLAVDVELDDRARLDRRRLDALRAPHADLEHRQMRALVEPLAALGEIAEREV